MGLLQNAKLNIKNFKDNLKSGIIGKVNEISNATSPNKSFGSNLKSVASIAVDDIGDIFNATGNAVTKNTGADQKTLKQRFQQDFNEPRSWVNPLPRLTALGEISADAGTTVAGEFLRSFGKTFKSVAEKGPGAFNLGKADRSSVLNFISSPEVENVGNLLDAIEPSGLPLMAGLSKIDNIPGLRSLSRNADEADTLLRSGNKAIRTIIPDIPSGGVPDVVKTVDEIPFDFGDLSKSRLKIGDEQIRKSAKGLFRRFGKAGDNIARLIDDFENTVKVKSTTAFNKFSDVYQGLSKQVGRTPTTGADNENVINYLIKWGNGDPNIPRISPAQKQVAESFFRDITLEPSTIAGKLDLSPAGKVAGKPRPFIPLVIKDPQKYFDAHLARLQDAGYSIEDAREILQGLKGNVGTGNRTFASQFPGFEKARFFEPKSYQDLVDFGYETDLLEIAKRWSEGAWKRISAVERFGGKKYEGMEEVFRQMQRAGADKNDIRTLKNAFYNIVEGRERANEGIENIAKTVKSLSSMKLSLNSGVQQPLALAQTMSVAGFKNTLSSIVPKLSKNVPDDVIRNSGIILGDDWKKAALIETSGVSTKNALVKSIDKVADLNFKITGIQKMDSKVRRVAGYAGFKWIDESIQSLKSGKLSAREATSLRRMLERFAFPNPKTLDKAIETGRLSDNEMAKAVYHFVGETQFGAKRSNLPLSWSNSPTGEMLTVLRSFSFEALRLTKDLAKEAVRGNPEPLLKLVAGTVALGYPIKKAKDFVNEKVYGKEQDESSLAKDIMEIAGNSMFGIFYDTIQSPRYSSLPTGAGLVTGVPGSTVARAGESVYRDINKSLKDDKISAEQTLKFLTNEIPIVGRGIRNRIFDDTKPKLPTLDSTRSDVEIPSLKN